ncbi:uncharacterized protein ATNIH1004_005425 [Aspergillus tanneri]|uniref:Uncharacterized protein n=1 Tax=Aspergillus tanneri TaxID=1220188 RepID=A0A5M9MN77_9EURO|nr:uncharacterized protein ATNIH1004_005425 [Aspergillus tanneri]KAA8646750.1 hypothetical protein ATNIH1004_005425 [Aspergillus tanneri]
MEERACSEAQTDLGAYYKVAMKTFVDNICRQVVERHIINKLPDVFSPVTAQLLDGTPYITGYIEKFQNPPLSDLFGLDIVTEWGRLVNLCRDYNNQHLEAMFTLGTIAFADNANMSLLRRMAAICILKDAKDLKLPLHTGYSGFQLNDKPTQESLGTLMDRYPEILNDGASFDRAYNFVTESEDLCRDECHALAKKLLQQWPCPNPSNSNQTATHIDVNKVLGMVQEEWLRLFKNFEFAQTLLDFQKSLTNIRVDLIR